MFYVGATLPPPPLALDGPVPPVHLTGAYHVHSVRSDGTGTPDDIAAAAAAARLQFVILTDHGDATRPPDPPAYRHGVLVIDAVEIGTDDGHLVALGLTGPSPYPLAGRPRDVIDDIHRLGGFAVLAHPDSPDAGRRWRAQMLPFDGIEWLNADSEWRDEPPRRLLAAAARSLVRPAGTIVSLFARPARSLQRWDAAAADRPVFGLAAVDAHARMAWDGQEGQGRTLLRRPSYRAMFGTVAQVAVLGQPPTGDAATDARLLLDALIHGHSFSIVRALAEPAPLVFEASRADELVGAGGRLPVTGEDVVFRARLPGAPGVRLALLHDGGPAAAGHGTVEHRTSRPGVYRIEASFPGASVPWVVSNPIVIDTIDARSAQPGVGAAQASADEPAGHSLVVPLLAEQWTVEREPRSEGRISAEAGELKFDYRLAAGAPSGQYAALVNPIRRDAGINRVEFTGRADRPMRISVQLRLPGGRDGQRWRHSVYLDTAPRAIVVRLEDFEPADALTSRRPIVASVQSLLFVVDTVNSAPGSSGTFWISDVQLGLAEMK
jgi:hypothetical protein